MRLYDVYWYILAAQLVIGLLTLCYVAIIGLFSPILIGHIITGFIMGVTALISVAVYPSLFADVVYVNQVNVSWNPYWWYYFAFGFGTTFTSYFILINSDRHFTPVLILTALIASTFVVSVVYLYKRHRHIGIP